MRSDSERPNAGTWAAGFASLAAAAVDVDTQVDQALQKLLPALADQPLSTLPKDSPEAQAIRAIRTGGDGRIQGDNKREQAEWEAKRGLLGL